MAWNDSGNGKNPWNRDDQEPNDIDQIVRNWQRNFSKILGGGGGSSSGSGGSIALIVMLLLGWGLSGIYKVDQAERGVVQRIASTTVCSTAP